MSDTFEMFRLSLPVRRSRDFFEADQGEGSRESFLRYAFSTSFQFGTSHRPYYFVPIPIDDSEFPYLAGRIGKSTTVVENLPPERGLEETSRDLWRATFMFLDPRHHHDGQKLAIAQHSGMPKPLTLAERAVKYINNFDPIPPYNIQVAPIVDTSTFWDYAEDTAGTMTCLTFNFFVPNMFGGTDELTRELREFKEQEQAKSVDFTLKSDEGLQADTQKVRSAVEYVEKGGGVIKARAQHKAPYNSSNNIVKRTAEELQSAGIDIIERIKVAARRVMGDE